MSSFFTISNVVHQGGILSPSLFAVYMDDFSSLLNASRIGSHINDVCINHVFYADDLCLMAPCAIALQELLSICYRYSVEVNLNTPQSLFALLSHLNTINYHYHHCL